jgi:hypothetical protein
LNILLSILSQDTKQEHSRLVSLPVVPNPGQIVMVGQTKLVVQSLIFQADSDEIQAMSESHAVSNAADLVKAGWRNTQDEPYHEVPKAAELPATPVATPPPQGWPESEAPKSKRGKR